MSSEKFMPPWAHILCPIDFSGRSVRALGAAVVLAQRDGAALSMVHVTMPILSSTVPVTPPSMSVMAATADIGVLQQEIREAHDQKLEHLASEVVPASIDCHRQVRVGRPADELAAYVEEQGIDLIVMASRGHGRWMRFLFGSVAGRLIKLVDCATLILPIP